jgi:pimeloyl-ACP methyl ester carboxylesterase
MPTAAASAADSASLADPPLLATRDVGTRGARVRFFEAGSGPPVVLVHGYLSDRASWRAVVPELARRYRVIVPDLPGFGDSEKPPPARYAYGFDTFADSIVDVIAGLDLGRTSIVGHAMGGAVALTVAANHPDMVSRLALLAPLVYGAELGPIARVAPLPVLGPIVFKQLYSRAMFRRYFRERVYSSLDKMPWDRVDHLFDAFNKPAAREAAYSAMLAMLDTRALVARVPRVTAPALVVWGREDRAAPVAQGRRLVRELPHARFEVFECGHVPHEECPGALVDVLGAFFSRNGPSGTS